MTLETYIEELGDESSPVKRSGLLQLSSLTRDDARDFRRLWRHVGRNRRHEVLTALVELNEDNLELDFSAIFRSCLSDESEQVREQATRGLLDSDDRAIIRPLIGLLKDDSSAKVREAAAIALSQFADLAQQGKLMKRDEERVKEALLEVIARGEDVPDVYRRAIAGLLYRVFADMLAATCSRIRDENVQSGFLPGPELLDTLIRFTKDVP